MIPAQLIDPVRYHFELFQKEYHRHTRNAVPLLCEVEDYLAGHPGKQLRPLLVLLSAQACGSMANGHIVLATVVELLHNATLMHDDVVDESDNRRGHDSVRHRWGNQVAVLCGDYYLAEAMSALHWVNDKTITDIVNRTVRTMCEGELKQLASANKPLDEETYIDIIGCKTASLMSACCALGACHIHEPQPILENMMALKDFGYHYGIVYQIRDDMHDSDARHDATLQSAVDPQRLINHHTQLATDALRPIPDSPAKQALLSLLLSTAPQPDNNTQSSN